MRSHAAVTALCAAVKRTSRSGARQLFVLLAALVCSATAGTTDVDVQHLDAAGVLRPAPQVDDPLWHHLRNGKDCVPVYREAEELRTRARPGITPHEFADVLQRASGMKANVFYAGDAVPAMIFLRGQGNARSLPDHTFTLVRGRKACAELAARHSEGATAVPATSSAPMARQAPAAPRTSFNCGKATSVAEKLICTDEELAALDLKLSEAFATAVRASPDPTALRKQAVSAWRERERQCMDKQCLLHWYQRRLDSLR